MNIEYKIIPKSNVVAKSQDGLSLVIKTILSDVEATDENGNKVVMEDLITILPEPNEGAYTPFSSITEAMILAWIVEIDTFNFEGVKNSLRVELEMREASNVIVDGKLPYQV